MAKFLFMVAATLFSALVAFWPEVALYAIYTSVNPVTELGRIALTLGLIFFGGGLCVAMLFLGAVIWFGALKVVLD